MAGASMCFGGSGCLWSSVMVVSGQALFCINVSSVTRFMRQSFAPVWDTKLYSMVSVELVYRP